MDLIKALDKVEGIERYRISSIEPNLLTDEIIEFVASSKRFVPHFHIPLQSGSPEVLKLMKRRYKRDLYTERVKRIKELMPDCCIGVDVIVGHPGETHGHFLETYQFLQELDISYLHVFSYSERVNTAAVDIHPKASKSDKVERSKMLHILSDKKKRAFYESQKNRTYSVLWEDDVTDGYMHGWTPNYVRVRAKYDPLRVNTLMNITLIDFAPEDCVIDIMEPEIAFEKH